jgi:peptide/nickel transport system permease protein
MEIFNGLPKLLLIISITAVIEQRSIALLVLIIGLTSWTEIARYTRAELLRIRELDYMQAAKAMGLSTWRMVWKHALPNALSPVLVAVSFGIAGAILTESGLSFLGIGVPEEAVTWGSMLNKGRIEIEAWWLMIFPGMAIFFTVMIFNLIGEGWRDAADPRSKR